MGPSRDRDDAPRTGVTPRSLVTDAPWPPGSRPDSWHEWRQTLPALAKTVLSEWNLRPDGYRRVGECALVLGVLTDAGEPAAAKFGWRHPESEHEHLVLRLWDGSGAVRMLRADPARGVLLLERLGPDDLTTLPVPTACEVIAGLYSRLHRPSTPQLALLPEQCRRWSDELSALSDTASVPRRLVRQAAALATDFASDTVERRILHGDLHFSNVLAGRREPWLAIDPKPMSGDPCFEAAPLLWNRWHEAVATGNVRTALRERMFLLADITGWDIDRARGWIIVRCMVNVLWALQGVKSHRGDEREWITRSVAIAKAVQA